MAKVASKEILNAKQGSLWHFKRNSRLAVGAGGAREARAHASAASWNACREKRSDRWDAHANKSDVHVSSLRMRGFLAGKGEGAWLSHISESPHVT